MCAHACLCLSRLFVNRLISEPPDRACNEQISINTCGQGVSNEIHLRCVGRSCFKSEPMNRQTCTRTRLPVTVRATNRPATTPVDDGFQTKFTYNVGRPEPMNRQMCTPYRLTVVWNKISATQDTEQWQW